MSTYLVGQVRPSQLLWTYGPGALIDLPNLSVLTMGLDRWNPDRCPPIEEARLLAAVRRVLGPQVERLRMPPFLREDGVDPMSAEGKIGVPVRPFPRWLRCVKCGLLAEYDSGLFDIKANPYRPEQTHFVHSNCEKGKERRRGFPPVFCLLVQERSPRRFSVALVRAWRPLRVQRYVAFLRARRIPADRKPLGQMRYLRCRTLSGPCLRAGCAGKSSRL